MTLAVDFRHQELVKARLIPCRICGRPMKDPTSIKLGFGPSHMKQKMPGVQAKIRNILAEKGLSLAEAKSMARNAMDNDDHRFVGIPRDSKGGVPAKVKGVDVSGQVPFPKKRQAAQKPKYKAGDVLEVRAKNGDLVNIKVRSVDRQGGIHGVALDSAGEARRGDRVAVNADAVERQIDTKRLKSGYLQTDAELNSRGEWEDGGNMAERRLAREEALADQKADKGNVRERVQDLIDNGMPPAKKAPAKRAAAARKKPAPKKRAPMLPGGQNQPRDTADAKRRAEKPKRRGIAGGLFGSKTMRERNMTVNTQGQAEPRQAVQARRAKRDADRKRVPDVIVAAIGQHDDATREALDRVKRGNLNKREMIVFVGAVAAVRERDGVEAGVIRDGYLDYAKRMDVDGNAVEALAYDWLKAKGEGVTAAPTGKLDLPRQGEAFNDDQFNDLMHEAAEWADQNGFDRGDHALFIDIVAAHALQHEGRGTIAANERNEADLYAFNNGVPADRRKRAIDAADKWARDNGLNVGKPAAPPARAAKKPAKKAPAKKAPAKKVPQKAAGKGDLAADKAKEMFPRDKKKQHIFEQAVKAMSAKDGGNKKQADALWDDLDLWAFDNKYDHDKLNEVVDRAESWARGDVQTGKLKTEAPAKKAPARKPVPKKPEEIEGPSGKFGPRPPIPDDVRDEGRKRYPNDPLKRALWDRWNHILRLEEEGEYTEADRWGDNQKNLMADYGLGYTQAGEILDKVMAWRHDRERAQEQRLKGGGGPAPDLDLDNHDPEAYAEAVGAYYGIEIDPEAKPNGDDGNWVKDGPYPAAIRTGTPAADHFKKGGLLRDAPQDGLFDFVMQQIGVENGMGLNPGEVGVQQGRGRQYGKRPMYGAADPKRFRVRNLSGSGDGGVSPNYFVEQLDENGKVIDWMMLKGSSSFFRHDVEAEVVNNRLLKAWGVQMPDVQFARRQDANGPKWLRMEHAIPGVFPSAAMDSDGGFPGYEFGDGNDLPWNLNFGDAFRNDRLTMLKMVLHDHLSQNGDRHGANWMWARDADGNYKLVVIDNGGGNWQYKGGEVKFGFGGWLAYLAAVYQDDEPALRRDLTKLLKDAAKVDLEELLAEFDDLDPTFLQAFKLSYKQRLKAITDRVDDIIRSIEGKF